MNKLARPGLLITLLAAITASANAAEQTVSIAGIGEGAEMAIRQTGNWNLRDASLDGKLVKADELPLTIAGTPAKTLLVFLESDQPGASVAVSASASAKELGKQIAAVLAADAAASTAAPTTKPAYVEANENDPILRAARDAKSAVIVVTVPTSSRTPVSQSARAFRLAIKESLGNSYAGSVDTVLPARDTSKETLRVGIYDGPGSNNSPGPEAMYGILENTPNAVFTFVGPREINAESLKQFDVVMFPGGSGGGQARAVGEDGREALRNFISGGGAFIGNCAGGYFASTSYEWSLNILNVKTVDTADGAWARGSGNVQVEFTDEGKKLLKGDGTVTLRYANGPIYAKGDHADLPEVEILAYYRSQIHRNSKSQDGVMIDTPAIIAAPYGNGRALAFSCHPEYSKEYSDFVRQALYWVTKKDQK